jgi:hypothetical protein
MKTLTQCQCTIRRNSCTHSPFLGNRTHQHPSTNHVTPCHALNKNSNLPGYCYIKPYTSLNSYFRNLNTGKPVQWHIGTKTINPILIERQSGGRIYIDMKNHINLKRPQPSDFQHIQVTNYALGVGTVTMTSTT